MESFLTGDGYYYFYSAILQGFAALLGVLIVGVVFKFAGIDRYLEDLIEKMASRTIKLSMHSKEQIAEEVKNRVNAVVANGGPIGDPLGIHEKTYSILKETKEKYISLNDNKELLKSKLRSISILSLAIILFSTVSLGAKDVIPGFMEVYFLLASISYIVYLLHLYYDFILVCFIQGEDDIYDKISKILKKAKV